MDVQCIFLHLIDGLDLVLLAHRCSLQICMVKTVFMQNCALSDSHLVHLCPFSITLSFVRHVDFRAIKHEISPQFSVFGVIRAQNLFNFLFSLNYRSFTVESHPESGICMT